MADNGCSVLRAFMVPGKAEMQAMLGLALPVVVVQVGMMTMGVVDTMVVGRLSAEGLAAVALGNLAVMAISSFGFGLVMVLDPLVAQAVGAGDDGAAARAVQRGMLLAVCMTIPAVLILASAEPVLILLRQPPEIIPLAAGYILRCLPGLLPMFAFLVLRHTLQALEKLRPIVVTAVVANLINLVLDIAMVHGHLGIPAMGVYGSAWATTISRCALLVILLTLAWTELWPMLRSVDSAAFRLQPLVAILRLGLPIAVQVQLEFVAFTVIALLMGGLGTVEMASHQVAINLASLTFMVPLGVSAAAAVRVGHAVGRDDVEQAVLASSAAIVLGSGFMAMMAAVFLLVPGLLAAAYTNDRVVIALAATLIPVAGVFQVFDGIQVVAAGVLRGLGDTRMPMVVNILGFWMLGMPVSLYLGFKSGFGPVGLWWGLVVGLGSVAVLLMIRIKILFARPLKRVTVE